MSQDREEELVINPVFTGLTRPPMIMGITVDYFGVCALIALCGFILFSSAFFLLLYIPLHVIGVIFCMIDPNLFKILFKKSNCTNVANKSIWGCQSYEPY